MANKTVSPSQENYDPHIESLKYQLELLKGEIETIENINTRLDEITQTTKNWAIITWGGSLTVMLGDPNLRKFIALSAVFPLLFWGVEAFWKQLQRRSGFRRMKIGEFLNDERLVKSFETKKLMGFYILDPTSKTYRNNKEYQKYVSVWRTLKFPEVWMFYVPLVIISISLGVLFFFIP